MKRRLLHRGSDGAVAFLLDRQSAIYGQVVPDYEAGLFGAEPHDNSGYFVGLRRAADRVRVRRILALRHVGSEPGYHRRVYASGVHSVDPDPGPHLLMKYGLSRTLGEAGRLPLFIFQKRSSGC